MHLLEASEKYMPQLEYHSIISVSIAARFDGVDVVLCTVDLAEDGHPTRLKLVDGISVDW